MWIFLCSCQGCENLDVLLSYYNPSYWDVLAAKRFLTGSEASFVRTCSLEMSNSSRVRLSNPLQTLHYMCRHMCASVLTWTDFDLQVAVYGLKYFSSLALSPLAQWHPEARIIGALTASYLLPESVSDNLLVWTVSYSFLLFLILLKRRKRLWIAFFSQVVLKLIYIAVRLLSASFEDFHLPVWT